MSATSYQHYVGKHERTHNGFPYLFSEATKHRGELVINALHKAAMQRPNVVRHKIKFILKETDDGYVIWSGFPDYFPAWAAKIADALLENADPSSPDYEPNES